MTARPSLLLAFLALLLAGRLAAALAQSPAAKQAIGSDKECTAAGQKIAAANPAIPLNTQLVATHYAHTTGRCYVLLTLVADGSGNAQSTIRTLYRGESGEVLAIASDQPGGRSGMVFDDSHIAFTRENEGYDDALAYIDSKMAFD